MKHSGWLWNCRAWDRSKATGFTGDLLGATVGVWFVADSYCLCRDKPSSLLWNLQDILEGGNLRVPLQELHQMILTPIKAYSSQNSSTEEHSRDADSHHPSSLISSDSQGSDCKDSAAGGMQQHHLPGCEGESGGAPLPEGDLPGQFTRVMGKGERLSFIMGILARVSCFGTGQWWCWQQPFPEPLRATVLGVMIVLRPHCAVVRGKSVGGETGRGFWEGQQWFGLPTPGQGQVTSAPCPRSGTGNILSLLQVKGR